MSAARILIVGGGVAGLATAWHLANRGARGVVLLERESQLASHSSALNAAILRTLAVDPQTAALLGRSAGFFAAPPAGFSDVALLDARGLVLVPAAARAAELRARSLDAAGTPIARAELERLVPHLTADVRDALWFPREGRIDIAALVAGFARGARAGGVAVEAGAAVGELVLERGAVRGARLTDGSLVAAETTVLAAGGWAGELGRAAGSRLRLTPTRRHLMVSAPEARVDPRWPVVWDDGEGFYARPESGGLLSCACDETPVEPDHCRPDPAVRQLLAEKLARSLPGFAEAGAAHFWCGMRTFARDRRFAVGPDPDVAGLFWVAALGGHGMGASPEVGRIAARRLLGAPAADAVEAGVDPARLVPSAAGAL